MHKGSAKASWGAQCLCIRIVCIIHEYTSESNGKQIFNPFEDWGCSVRPALRPVEWCVL